MNLYDENNSIINYSSYSVQFAVEDESTQSTQTALTRDGSIINYGAANLTRDAGIAFSVNDRSRIMIQCVFQGVQKNISKIQIIVENTDQKPFYLRGTQVQIFNLADMGKTESGTYYPNKANSLPLFSYSIVDQITTPETTGFNQINILTSETFDSTGWNGYNLPFPNNLTSEIKYIRLIRYDSYPYVISFQGYMELENIQLYDENDVLISPNFGNNYTAAFKWYYATVNQESSGGAYSEASLTKNGDINQYGPINLIYPNEAGFAYTENNAPTSCTDCKNYTVNPPASLSGDQKYYLIIQIELIIPRKIKRIVLIKKSDRIEWRDRTENTQLQIFRNSDVGKTINNIYFPNIPNKPPMKFHTFIRNITGSFWDFFPSFTFNVDPNAVFPIPSIANIDQIPRYDAL
jgi:hypothetical protein